jgi:hypothetical protein
MVSVRTAKSKGSSFEYDTVFSLKQWTTLPVYLTKELGFQRQFDVAVGDIEKPTIAIECKRLKGVSWIQLMKFYEKLEKVAHKDSIKCLLFKSNFQPCLVFCKINGCYEVKLFEDIFKVPFLKHPSTRPKRKGDEISIPA